MVALLAVVALFQIDLPGTQPGELRNRIGDPSSCNRCHRGFDGSAGDTWAGSMMANAARDPIFRAALAIANQDVPGSGDLCLRCHTPRGWLEGRADPPDGSRLNATDWSSGVDCDFCHRLVRGDGHIGNSQFTLTDEPISFGRYADSRAQHGTAASDFVTSSELCGLCHDVTNPLTDFPIERTYTEWRNSAFWAEGEGCIDCHMPGVPGTIAVGDGLPQRTLHAHDLAGGNAWMPTVLASLYPEEADALLYAAEKAREMLQSAATVTIQTENSTPWGGVFEFSVRVENESGHKLPTGYPEGRRCWLEVQVLDADGQPLLHSGVWDEAEADRLDDPQLRTYEARLNQGGNQESFHFMLSDKRLLDDRIPPRGFRPVPGTEPVGREYPTLPDGTLAHWDEAPYAVMVPEGTQGPLIVRAVLRYQTTSKTYVEFLRDENRTDDTGQVLYDLWLEHGQSAPETIAESMTLVQLRAPLPPDAGPPPPIDGGPPADMGVPATPGAAVPQPAEGCRAAPGQGSRAPGSGGWLLAGLIGLAVGARRRRTAGGH